VRIVDLSFPIRKHFRWRVETEVQGSHARGDLFQSTRLSMPGHGYTHVDAPGHFLPVSFNVTP
jgi:kynurenine formamidase